MNIFFGNENSRLQSFLKAFALLGGGCLAVDILKFGFNDGLPRLDLLFLIRTLFYLLWCVVIVALVHNQAMHWHSGKPPMHSQNRIAWAEAKSLSLLGLIIVSWGFVILLIVKPYIFTQIALEDGPVEWITAFTFLISSALTLKFFLDLLNEKIAQKSLFLLFLLVASILFFLIGMEEVSWFQRVIGFQTPASFQSNIQDEFNFHNFATNPVEYAFYTGIFIALVFVPFVNQFLLVIKPSHPFYSLIPGPFVTHATALFTAYNFDMWNHALMQTSFFLTVFVLISYALISGSSIKYFQITLIGTLILTQLIFLLVGDNSLRLSDATEYKEFFIALGCLAYAVGVGGNISKMLARSKKEKRFESFS